MEKDKEKIEEEINENHESQDLDDSKEDNIDETILENNYSNATFFVPTKHEKISSWLYKNSYVYKQTYIHEEFIGNKITAKITIEKLKSFKSNFPNIKVNNKQKKFI